MKERDVKEYDIWNATELDLPLQGRPIVKFGQLKDIIEDKEEMSQLVKPGLQRDGGTGRVLCFYYHHMGIKLDGVDTYDRILSRIRCLMKVAEQAAKINSDTGKDNYFEYSDEIPKKDPKVIRSSPLGVYVRTLRQNNPEYAGKSGLWLLAARAEELKLRMSLWRRDYLSRIELGSQPVTEEPLCADLAKLYHGDVATVIRLAKESRELKEAEKRIAKRRKDLGTNSVG